MTTEEKIRTLHLMVGNESDEVLGTYLNIAGEKILSVAYPFGHEGKNVPARYDYLHCKIAAYMLNKRGAEGETSHSENGISRSYENADVPESMLSEVIPACGFPRKAGGK